MRRWTVGRSIVKSPRAQKNIERFPIGRDFYFLPFLFALAALEGGEVVVQIGWDFSTCGPRSMFNQFFTLLSRPGKQNGRLVCLKRCDVGMIFSRIHNSCLERGRYLLKVGMEIQIGTSWVDWMRRWRRDKKFFHQLTSTCPEPPFLRF